MSITHAYSSNRLYTSGSVRYFQFLLGRTRINSTNSSLRTAYLSLATLLETLGQILVQFLSECRLDGSLLLSVLLLQPFLFLEKR